MSDLAVLLAALAALAVLPGLARVFGAVAVRLGQPAVIGEIAGGLVVGAALSAGSDLPVRAGATLDAIAQFGLALFLFCVGAQVASSMTRARAGSALVPAAGAALVPFAAGARHEAVVFAALMNTRGVTELVFVSIGFGLGVIDSAFYTAMVVMALVTTAMTGPLLNRLRRPSEVARHG